VHGNCCKTAEGAAGSASAFVAAGADRRDRRGDAAQDKPGDHIAVAAGLAAAPAVPARFTERPREQENALEALAAAPGGAAPAVALVGRGGAGKSTLARRVAADDQTRGRFPDGVFWLDLGHGMDVAAGQARLAAARGDTRPVTEPGPGRERLRDLFAGTRCLVVLDDVGSAGDLRAFDVLPPGGALLVTTRDRRVLFENTVTIAVGGLDPAASSTLLARYADREVGGLPPEADKISRLCGGLPLALAIAIASASASASAGSMARRGRWKPVLERLRRADLGHLRTHLRDYPHRDPLPAHTVRSAAVGGSRDARTAGMRPANAPIRMAEAMPPDHASTGMTMSQCFAPA
jgi:hypothetical protein